LGFARAFSDRHSLSTAKNISAYQLFDISKTMPLGKNGSNNTLTICIINKYRYYTGPRAVENRREIKTKYGL
jgi:hypothetical protein